MIRDAQHIIDYATSPDGLNYDIRNVIVMGRSIGTGVAIQVAARYSLLRGIILVSSFTSIRDVAKHAVGSLLKVFVPDIFQSLDIIGEVKVPTLFIHGKKDDFIPYIQSVQLYEKSGAKKKLVLQEHMEHNRGRIERDIFKPIESFLTDDLELTDLDFLKINTMDIYDDDNSKSGRCSTISLPDPQRRPNINFLFKDRRHLYDLESEVDPEDTNLKESFRKRADSECLTLTSMLKNPL